ncbi:MAG: hypothetical protein IT196_02480 [Acidimicrobiales bacterium]|nr:hypothetical protein [Acidimicrobiales bacterium]
MRLLGEIALFIAAAVLVGFGAGWLTWRAGRRPVPEQEWRRLRDRSEQLERHLAELQGLLALHDTGRRDAEEDARRARQLLERAWADRDRLQARLDLLERETATARHERDLATGRMGQLQRRLAQLSVSRARSGGVPNGVLPTERIPPDPARIGLASMPAPSAPPLDLTGGAPGGDLGLGTGTEVVDGGVDAVEPWR